MDTKNGRHTRTRNTTHTRAAGEGDELSMSELCKCAREFINAIRKGKNQLAHYKMLELEGYLDQYERGCGNHE